MTRRHPLLVAVALLGATAGALAAQPASGSAARDFADTSSWNSKIPTDPVLDAKSGVMAKSLARTGAGIANLYRDGIPIYRIDSSTPRVHVTCTKPWGTCDLEKNPVPVPSNAMPNTGPDHAMVLVDRAAGRSYEFWQASKRNGHWFTGWGDIVPLNATGTGERVTGAGVSRLAGVVLAHEIAVRSIPHALVFSTDNACAMRFRYPASKTDGVSTRANCIPEGARIQLDPSIDVAKIPGISPGERVIARTLQVYGAYVIDNGAAPMAYSFERPKAGQDPYPAAGLKWDYFAMKRIPWSRVRVLARWDGR